jgi:RNA polymerase sigma factor (sigma-70 family)
MELNARRELLNRIASDSACADFQCDVGYSWESYRADLRAFVTRQLHSPQDTDDVVQAIYQRLLEYPPREVLRDPRAWLWRVAWRVLNLARQGHRDHRCHHVNVEPQFIEVLASQNRSDATASVETQIEAADELLAALEDLPPETQYAIIRSRRDGWSYEQIGEVLGVSKHMAKKHIIRAAKHFAAYSKRTDSSRKEARS